MRARTTAASLMMLALGVAAASPAVAQPRPGPAPARPGGGATDAINRIMNSVVRLADPQSPIHELIQRPIDWVPETPDDEATSLGPNGSGAGATMGGALGPYVTQGGGGPSEGGGDSVMSEDGYESVSYSSIYNDYSIDPGGDQGVTVTALEQSEFNAELEPVLDVLCGR